MMNCNSEFVWKMPICTVSNKKKTCIALEWIIWMNTSYQITVIYFKPSYLLLPNEKNTLARIQSVPKYLSTPFNQAEWFD